MFVDASLDTGWFNDASMPLDLRVPRTQWGGEPIKVFIYTRNVQNSDHIKLQSRNHPADPWETIEAFRLPVYYKNEDKPTVLEINRLNPALGRYIRFKIQGVIQGNVRAVVAMNEQGQG